MENKYYSSWILTLGYADVLYTVVENYIIVDEALYRVYDDGTLEKTRKEEAGILLPDEGDVLLTVEAYDGCYEPDFGMTTHTWKHTYLCYDGGIQYGYYTVRYEGGILEREPGEYNPGQMDVRFSDLEAVYAGNRRVSG